MSTESGAGPLVIGGESVEPGSRRAIKLPVTTNLSGGEVALWVHVVRGAQPGPTLVLLGGMHGDEWFTIEPIRRLLELTDPATLRGTVIAVPFVNSQALGQHMRNMPDNTDSPDMNRLFPGPLTNTSDQIIAKLTKEVVSHATHLLDFHIGPWGSAFNDMLIGGDIKDPEIAAESERLALIFGCPIVRAAAVMTGFPGPRSSLGYGAGVLGVPTIGVEVGGSGFAPEVEERWRQRNVDGIQAVMGAIGMIDGAPDPRPEKQLVYRTAYRLNPSVGGLLQPKIGPDRLSTRVEAGELLGEVRSPYTLEVIEELRVSTPGILTYISRDYPVNPGDWAFGIAVSDGPDARWVTRSETA